MAIERKFDRNAQFKERCSNEMRALFMNGYMKIADRRPEGIVYYLPHHAVMKKFRVVFDASCKSDGGLSLNECQFVGELLQSLRYYRY